MAFIYFCARHQRNKQNIGQKETDREARERMERGREIESEKKYHCFIGCCVVHYAIVYTYYKVVVLIASDRRITVHTILFIL